MTMTDKTGEKYDQFAGRVNTFEFSEYSTKIDLTKITSGQIIEAMKIEKQIDQNKTEEVEDEEMEFSAV